MITMDTFLQKIDPILKNILNTLQQKEKTTWTTTQKIQNYTNLSNWIQSLQNEINKLPSISKRQHNDIETIMVLVEYIMIPINLLLRLESDENDTASIISLKWRILQFASSAISTLFHNLQTNVNEEWFMILLVRSKKWILQSLVSCGIALSNLEEDKQGSLDTNTNAKESILKCIQCIMHFISNKSGNDDILKNAMLTINKIDKEDSKRMTLSTIILNEMISIMNGGLIARILESCLSILTNNQKNNSLIKQALYTILAIQNTIPKRKLQELVPGITSSLCKFLLYKLRHGRGDKNDALGLYILGRLLFLTLGGVEKQDKGGSSKDILSSFLDAVQKNNQATTKQLQGNDTQFYKNIIKYLSAPLHTIYQLLVSNYTNTAVSSSYNIQLASIALSRIVLVDTFHVWSEKQELCQYIMEYCLLLQNDDRITPPIQTILESNELLSKMTSSRIIELISQVSNSVKTTSKSNSILLLSGYLKYVSRSDLDGVAVSLSCDSVGAILRQSFSGLLEIDTSNTIVSAITTTDVIPSSSSSIDNSILKYGSSNLAQHDINFLHSDKVQLKTIQGILQQIGYVLGNKRSIVFVDACFYDLFHNDKSMDLGLILVAKEILLGSFDKNKNIKLVITLSRTIIPLILDNTHWNTPSNIYLQSLLLDFIGTLSYLLQENFKPFLPIVLYPIIEKLNPVNHSMVTNVAFLTLQRISMLTTSSSNVCDLLSSNFDYLVDSITAKLHCSTTYFSINDDKEKEYLFLPGVVEVALRCTFLNNDSTRNSELQQLHPSPSITLLSDLIQSVLNAFDRRISTIVSTFQTSTNDHVKSLYYSYLLSMSRLLGVMMQSLNVMFLNIFDRNDKTKTIEAGSSASKPWIEYLLLSIDNDASASNEDIIEDQEDGNSDDFNDHHNEQSKENNNDMQTHVKKQMELIHEIVTRCTFFLSLEHLKIQINIIDAIQVGYTLSYDISLKSSSSNLNLPGNPLLMSISDHWPNIHARLKATATSIITYHQRKRKVNISFAITSSNLQSNYNPYIDENNYGSLSHFYSALLDIVGLLCELADDFMIGRLENDIWPILSKVLAAYIRQLPSNKQRASYSQTQPVEIISTLKCLSRIFAVRNCGIKLIPILPSICTLLLPMLSVHGDIGELTMTTLQSLLVLDVSLLYRSVYELSGEEMRRNPLVILFKKDEMNKSLKKNTGSLHTSSCDAITPDDRIKFRARLLLQFIDTIDEQALT